VTDWLTRDTGKRFIGHRKAIKFNVRIDFPIEKHSILTHICVNPFEMIVFSLVSHFFPLPTTSTIGARDAR
jgi:hypothetical protein